MRVNKKKYQSIWTDGENRVFIIDQTLLPYSFRELELKTADDAGKAISLMQVRGAPLIGVTAAFGIYLASCEDSSDENLHAAKKALIQTRPTAINLKWAVEQMVAKLLKLESSKRNKAAFDLAKEFEEKDIRINQKIGNNGFEVIKKIYEKKKDTVNILTHCNAGWLATVDRGTATAPIYKARDMGIPLHVWVDETRPRNQGSQLTAWELKNEEIDHTIIPDNTGGHLMQRQMVDVVITGSDRTTYTGDVCNKIGTYLKALAAFDNNVPFYVALPTSTIDWDIDDGQKIIIEERDEDEIHYIKGLDDNSEIVNLRITPEGSKGSNFAFDVTPSKLVAGLITENGICLPNENDIKKTNA